MKKKGYVTQWNVWYSSSTGYALRRNESMSVVGQSNEQHYFGRHSTWTVRKYCTVDNFFYDFLSCCGQII